MGVTTSRRGIVRVVDGTASTTTDAVAVEAPLTIILDGEVLVTTMRTPGHDLDLVAGWLVNESGVARPGDIAGMGAFAAHDDEGVDAVRVSLAAGVDATAAAGLRHQQRLRGLQRGRPGGVHRTRRPAAERRLGACPPMRSPPSSTACATGSACSTRRAHSTRPPW